MTRALSRFRWVLLMLALAVATVGTSACVTVRLVGDYDEKVDQLATELQRRMDAHITRLENLPASDPGRAYDANRQFYMDYGVDLRALETRAAGIPRNTITVRQIDLMEQSLEQLRSTHQQQGTLSPAALGPYRELFNTSWRAILAFELGKKRS